MSLLRLEVEALAVALHFGAPFTCVAFDGLPVRLGPGSGLGLQIVPAIKKTEMRGQGAVS